MDTDQVLGACAASALAICALCVGINAWRNGKWPPRPVSLKISKSDTDLTSMLENAIPSASATRRPPTEASSEA